MEVTKQLVETSWFHAENFIWLFDAAGSGWSTRPGIEKTLQFSVQKIIPARQYKLLNKKNRIVILLPTVADLYRQKMGGSPVAETDLLHPPALITHIEGVLSDDSRYYNPRCFALDLTTLDTKNPYQNALALYRNITAILLTRAGNVTGSLHTEARGPFAWAVLTLTIIIPDMPNLVLKTQANQFGDFVFSLDELPALETDSLIADYSASLAFQSCEVIDGIPDPDRLSVLQVKQISGGNDFVAAVNLKLVPGEQHRLKSQGETALVVKTSA